MQLAEIHNRIRKTPTGCWEFDGAHLASGYGSVRWQGRATVVHRVMYEQLVGPIADGLQIDHLCRNRGCCNPEHLEPVPQAINLLRGESGPANNARKTHCLNGHEFDMRYPNGWRDCSICKRERRRAYRERTGR